MDAIRARHLPSAQPAMKPMRGPVAPSVPTASSSKPETPVERFQRSMIIDYEKWHDGIGYDLGVLREASAEERKAIETLLLNGGVGDWRDVEALAALGTSRALEALKAPVNSKDHKVRAAVIEYAPELVPDTKRTASIIKALDSADLYSGLSETLDQIKDFPSARRSAPLSMLKSISSSLS